jgi:porin
MMDPLRALRRLLPVVALWSVSPAVSLAQGPIDSGNSALQSQSMFGRASSESKWVRETLEQHGYSFQGQFVQDFSAVAPEPPTASAGLGRYSIDLSLAIDGEKAGGWKGSAGFARLKHHQAEFGGSYDLSAQVYSNIDAPSRTYLYELWLQQSLSEGKVRVKFGKIDTNTEFAAVATAADFLNSSMGFSPTIVAFPTYPQPKLGLAAFLQPGRQYGVGLGVFATSGMGTMTLAEPQFNWLSGGNELRGRASVGYWRLDGDIPGGGDLDLASTQGLYAVVEQDALRHALAQAATERRLSFFFQFGSAEGKASPITQHLGVGAVMQAVLSSRPKDTLGLGATWARFSHTPGAGFDYARELVAEVYYKVSLIRHVALVQDFQFLHQPGGVRAQPDCAVITPRLTLSF